MTILQKCLHRSTGVVLAVALAFISFGIVSTALFIGPAYAQPSLSQMQIAAAQMQVKLACEAVNKRTFPNNAAKQKAFAEAIALLTKTLIAADGGAVASEITSIVLDTGSMCGATPAAIGAGLGVAAAQLAQDNPAVATAIAQTIANEGLVGTGPAFVLAFTEAGGPREIALLAIGNPVAAGSAGRESERDREDRGERGDRGEHGEHDRPPCGNPSCT